MGLEQIVNQNASYLKTLFTALMKEVHDHRVSCLIYILRIIQFTVSDRCEQMVLILSKWSAIGRCNCVDEFLSNVEKCSSFSLQALSVVNALKGLTLKSVRTHKFEFYKS